MKKNLSKICQIKITIKLTVISSILSLTGCASVPVALTLASITGVGIGYTIVAEESPIDALVSYSIDKDCNAIRKGKDNGPYCRSIKNEIKSKTQLIQTSSRCYKTLGGMVCYENEQEGVREVNLQADGLKLLPVIASTEQDTKQEIADEELPEEGLKNINQEEQQNNDLSIGENIRAKVLTTPSIPEVLLSGASLKPFPKNSRTRYVPDKKKEENEKGQYGGLDNYFPGLDVSKKAVELRNSLIESEKNQNEAEQDGSYRQYGANSKAVGQSRLGLSGQPGEAKKPKFKQGLGAPLGGAFLTGPYKDYNPSWIKPFPYSYRKQGLKEDNTIYYQLPGLNRN